MLQSENVIRYQLGRQTPSERDNRHDWLDFIGDPKVGDQLAGELLADETGQVDNACHFERRRLESMQQKSVSNHSDVMRAELVIEYVLNGDWDKAWELERDTYLNVLPREIWEQWTRFTIEILIKNRDYLIRI